MTAFREAVEDYLALRRKLGADLKGAGRLLLHFTSFLEQEGAPYITIELSLRWAQQPRNVQLATRADRLGIARRFAQYYSAIDPRTQVPPLGLLPRHYQRKQPYIFTDDEITGLVAVAQQLSSPTGLRPRTYSTLFGLLAVTGMRISEPLDLNQDEVDLEAGVITIRRTKFRKTRLLPVHPSTVRMLQQYAGLRDRIYPRPQTPSFFVSERGTRLTQCAVRWTFVQLSRRIGLRSWSKSHGYGPRLHDLRHAFAVRTILRWYHAGVDVERQIPKLATYLGHTHVTDTYWYLSAVPELLHLAAQRLESPTFGGVSS